MRKSIEENNKLLSMGDHKQYLFSLSYLLWCEVVQKTLTRVSKNYISITISRKTSTTTLTTATTATTATAATTLTRATWGHTFVPRGRTWHWCLRTFHGVIHELLTRSSPSVFSDQLEHLTKLFQYTMIGLSIKSVDVTMTVNF